MSVSVMVFLSVRYTVADSTGYRNPGPFDHISVTLLFSETFRFCLEGQPQGYPLRDLLQPGAYNDIPEQSSLQTVISQYVIITR